MSAECKIHLTIHYRGQTEKPRYCVEAECRTHESSWNGLTDDFDTAGDMMHSFPLVHGGLAFGKDALPIHRDCIIGKMQ